MKRRIALVVWLVVAWVALWQQLSFANVVSGLVVAVALAVLFPVGRGDRQTHLRPLATLRFGAFFAWKLLEANAIVAWQALRPAEGVVEGIVAVPLRVSSDGVATIVANAVTLTPGTMTMEIRRDPPLPDPPEGPPTLYVHVLQLGDPDDVRRDVWRFEELAVRAFGPDQGAGVS